ncbi:MAG: winged helix-turn-helix transcriptional regulator [Acidobacteria bacterium]|nr:winged helix-turn-helix transcriptional regulator [Acidobacteriota bacterium]
MSKMHAAAPLTPLFISVFRLNGALIAAGDRLVADLDLTSARWQVLGVVANVPAPLSVASIARTIGLTRQGVRGVTAELVASGLVEFKPNPHHRRAQLVVLTDKGREVEHAARRRQIPWATALGKGLKPRHIEEAAMLLQTVLARLERHSDTQKDEL